MGANTKIEWCHHTFNPWWGCTKVSPACDHCYAEAWAKRTGFKIWGKDEPRRFFGVDHWQELLRWNRDAEKADERRRVFCGSMCDVLEDRDDVRFCREALWGLVDQTPWLDWLLLTKRPQNFSRFLPPLWLKDPRPNVWLMTTVESADYIWRIVEILKVPAVVHGISYEPALGPVDWERWLGDTQPGEAGLHRGVKWLIAGTESGASARTADLQWFRDARDKCREAGAAFFMKQITEKGQKIPFEHWPRDLRVRELPTLRPWRD
jgi:protein gp37